MTRVCTERTCVGQYLLGKIIGEGAFGKVWLAIHQPSGEKVAVKILEKNEIREESEVRSIHREIEILKTAQHSNIIQLYEVLENKDTTCVVMEYAERGELFDFIKAQKRVSELQACKFFHQIVDGVEMLHRNNITHRDLKPENLLLKESPNGLVIKIVDFGLSTKDEEGKLLRTACGSPCYSAPEMIANREYFGPLTDTWSIGIILYVLVCGFVPFKHKNPSVLYEKILSGKYSTPNWISAEVKDLIRRILETDPHQRYTLADIRRHPWFEAVADSDVPQDRMSDAEDAAVEEATMRAIVEQGQDSQAVLDELSSRAYGSLTAMYHLLRQKKRAQLLSLRRQRQGQGQSQQSSEVSCLPAVVTQAYSDVSRVFSEAMNGVSSVNSSLQIVFSDMRKF